MISFSISGIRNNFFFIITENRKILYTGILRLTVLWVKNYHNNKNIHKTKFKKMHLAHFSNNFVKRKRRLKISFSSLFTLTDIQKFFGHRSVKPYLLQNDHKTQKP